MGVGAGRAGRTEEPMEARGAGRSGCGPMGWRAGTLPLRCWRQVAAALGSVQEPVRVQIPEARGRPGERRRDPEPAECGAGLGGNSDERVRARPPMGAASHLHPPRGRVGGFRGERRDRREWEGAACARLGGSGPPRSESQGRVRSYGSGVPSLSVGALGCLGTTPRGRGSALRAR